MIYCYAAIYTYEISFVIIHQSLSYKNLVGELFFNTNGCLCTLGISPNPTALLIALAIFL